MHILINTPNGNVGRSLVPQLLAAGDIVTVITRNPDSLDEQVASRARVITGSFDDPSVLDRALAGVDAVFWVTPGQMRNDYAGWSLTAARAAVEAADRHGVRRAVVLSSIGAHTGPGTGPVGVLLAIEDMFRERLADVVALRPGYFMEDILRSLPTIATRGVIESPVPADKRMPAVAARDIAVVAMHELHSPAGGPKIRGVHGPADLSGLDMTQILSEVLERPIRYIQIPITETRSWLLSRGLPDEVAALFHELYQGVIAGRMDAAEERTPDTTTPTDYATFVREVVRPALARMTAASP